MSNQIEIIFITSGFIFLLTTFVLTLLFLYYKKQLIYQQKINSLQVEYETNLFRSQIEIHEETLNHLSGEIHDNINQSLILARLTLQSINFEVTENAENTVNESIGILNGVIQDLRDLSRSLSADQIANLGFEKSIEIEINRIKKVTNLKIEFSITGKPRLINSDKELILYRILQEALNNILKHAKATEIYIELCFSQEHLEMIIRDNGLGFESHKISEPFNNFTSGISNMKKRTAVIGGRFELISTKSKGTEIKIIIPFS